MEPKAKEFVKQSLNFFSKRTQNIYVHINTIANNFNSVQFESFISLINAFKTIFKFPDISAEAKIEVEKKLTRLYDQMKTNFLLQYSTKDDLLKYCLKYFSAIALELIHSNYEGSCIEDAIYLQQKMESKPEYNIQTTFVKTIGPEAHLAVVLSGQYVDPSFRVMCLVDLSKVSIVQRAQFGLVTSPLQDGKFYCQLLDTANLQVQHFAENEATFTFNASPMKFEESQKDDFESYFIEQHKAILEKAYKADTLLAPFVSSTGKDLQLCNLNLIKKKANLCCSCKSIATSYPNWGSPTLSIYKKVNMLLYNLQYEQS